MLSNAQGAPLRDPATWSAQLGSDVGDARLITGPEAAEAADAIDARAFTVGNRVFFGAGMDEHTDDGNLLAHELTHVVQQRGASAPAKWDELPLVDPGDQREVDARSHHAAGPHGGQAIARDAKGPPQDTARQYIQGSLGNMFTQSIYAFIAERLGSLQVVERGPFGDVLGNPVALTFAGQLATDAMLRTVTFRPGQNALQTTWGGADKLEAILAPEAMATIVDRARPMTYVKTGDDKVEKGDRGPGTTEYVEIVALELANAIARRYAESIKRIFPRFLTANFEQTKIFLIDENGKERPKQDYSVKPHNVLPSHPLVHYVIEALCLAQKDLDFEAIQKKYPTVRSDDHISQRAIKLELAPTGPRLMTLWHWVKAPDDVTAEEVAVALFGKPEESYRLIPMKPLWGFRARDVSAMTAWQRGALRARLEERGPEAADLAFAAGTHLSFVMPPPEIDPVLELVGRTGEAFALEHAKAHAGPKVKGEAPKDEKSIIAKLNENIRNLDTLRVSVPVFPRSATGVEAAMNHALARKAQASAGLTDCETLFTLVDQQGQALGKIAMTMAKAVSKLAGENKLAQPLALDPLLEVVDPLLSALDALELPELANPQIDVAAAFLDKIDISILEAKLHDAVPRTHFATQVANIGGVAYNPELAKSRSEYDLSVLSELRMTTGQNPAQATKDLAELKPQVDKTWFDATVGERLFALDALWDAIDTIDTFWSGEVENSLGSGLKKINRVYYEQFKAQVFDPYTKAEKEHDETQMALVRDQFATFIANKDFKAHAQLVIDHVERAARNTKWSKIVVALALAVVAFGLGQWEFAALAPEIGTGGAALIAGVSTTMTQGLLDKLVLNQNTTPGALVTGLITNVTMFAVIGEMASAARGAALEAEVGEATEQASKSAVEVVGNYAKQLTGQMLVAEAIGFVNSEAASLIDTGKTLSTEQLEDMFVQQLIGVIGMNMGQFMLESAVTGIKSAVLRRGIDVAWLEREHNELIKLGGEMGKKAKANPLAPPDRGTAVELLARWERFLKKDLAARRRIFELARTNPELIKKSDIERLKATQGDAALELQLDQARALIGVEQYGPNLYRAEPQAIDRLIAQHQSAGGKLVKLATDPDTNQRTLTIKTKGGAQLEITERLPERDRRTEPPIANAEALHFEQFLETLPGKGASPDDLEKLRVMYARDPQAAINAAEQLYNYEPVRPAAANKPGGGKAPVKPGAPPLDVAAAANAKAMGPGVISLGGDQYQARVGDLAELHTTASLDPGAQTSPIHYDSATNTSFYETGIRAGAKRLRVRVQADLGPRIESFNQIGAGESRIVGRPVSVEIGHTILERLNRGVASALNDVGLEGTGELPKSGMEFGLGRTSDGRAVIVAGAGTDVDWTHLPGVKPIGHTHPDIAGNDLPVVDGEASISLLELKRPTPEPMITREKILPSGADTVLMALMDVDGHLVYTPFVVKDGMVIKAKPGEPGPRLIFEIKKPVEIGTRTRDNNAVVKTTIEGTFNGEVVFSQDTWVVRNGEQISGHNYLSEPVDFVPKPATKPAATTGPKPPLKTAATVTYDLPTIKAKLETLAGKHVGADKTPPPPFDVEVLLPEDYARFHGDSGQHAVFRYDNNRAKIVAHPEATEADILAEVYHLRQLADPKLGAEIRMHEGVDKANWSKMSVTDRVESFRRMLLIEIDAHETMVKDQVAGAREQLAALRKLDTEVRSIRPDDLSMMNSGLKTPPPFLDEPAYLFTQQKNPTHARQKTAAALSSSRVEVPSRKIRGWSTAYEKPNVVRVDQVGETWPEQWQIASGYKGDVRVTKDAVIVTTESGAEHRYKIEEGATARRRTQPVEPPDILIDDQRRNYRRVEIFEEGKKTPEIREEIEMPDGHWIQRGEFSTTQGRIMEDAARAQVDDELATKAQAANAKGQYFDSFHVTERDGSGGFDDPVIEFTGSKRKPQAKVRLREVKDYPNRYVPVDEFTAIRGGGLVTNMDNMVEWLNRAIDSDNKLPVKGLEKASIAQLEAILDAIKFKQVEFEVVVSKETLMGDLKENSESVLAKLNDGVKKYGTLKTKDNEPFRVNQKFVKQAEAAEAAAVKAAAKAGKDAP